MKKTIRQIFKFALIGGVAFVIDYSILYLLTEWLGMHFLVSQIVSFLIAFIFNYYFSVIWVFDAGSKRSTKEIAFVLFGALIGLGITELILYIMSSVGSVHYMISKLVATVVAMIWNFLSRKYFLENQEKNLVK